MNYFWQFARRMLRYRAMLTVAGFAAIFDAMCAFSGFGALLLIIDRVFRQGVSVRELVQEKLGNETLVGIIGDQTHLADYLPQTLFWGLAVTLGFILILSVIGATFRYTHAMVSITVATRTVMRLRAEAFRRLLHVPLEVVMVEGSADNLSRVVRDCTQLTRGFTALMAKAVRDLLMGLVFLSLALIINWKLTVVFLIGFPLIFVVIRKFGKRIRRASKYALRAFGGMTAALQESLQSLEVVKVHTAEGYERRRFNTINRKVYTQEMRARTSRALGSPVIELIGIAGLAVVTLVAAHLVFERGEGQPLDIAGVLGMLAMAGMALRPLAKLNNDLQEASAAAERIDEVLKLPVERNTREGNRGDRTPLPRHHESIVFEDVHYRYPSADSDALRGVNLTVQFGQTVAIVGPNGSGKSTLLSVLPRLLEPSSGRVFIDGVDTDGANLRRLRGQMAVVTQKPVLFEGTIAENIAYGYRHAAMDDVEAAAKKACAHDFIAALPDGYGHQLGEGGSGLSGGQRQRLCIARAILRNPSILILDEATSQIDTESELKINQAMAEVRQGRTTFVIAHRLSTVVDSDMIVVMDGGTVADAGTHAELLERCELYRVLTKSQLLGGDQAA